MKSISFVSPQSCFFSFCIFQVRKRLPGGKRCKMMSILASERFLTLEVVSALSCRDKHTEAVEFDRLAKVWRCSACSEF